MKKLLPKSNNENIKDSELQENKSGLDFNSIESWIKSMQNKNNDKRLKSNEERDRRIGRKALTPNTPNMPVRGYKGKNGTKLYSRI